LGTISLCMIVRDEEENLERCLESVHSSVGEIIVVDTGSRDATPDIARRYGAALHLYPWQDDFSSARNESLKHATGEWVLVLDADEELPPETARSLRQLASRADVEAWIFTLVSPLAGPETQQVRHPGIRMFRNRKSHLFEGRIHEQIKPAILKENPGAVIEDSHLAILHHGYGENRRREKTLGHIAILKQALAESPGDPLHHYNLALNYFALGELEHSCQHYEAARQLLSTGGGLTAATAAFFRNYTICLRDLGEYEQALDLVDEGIASFPDYPDLQFIRGQLFADLNMLQQAKACFLKCTRFRQSQPGYIATEGVIDHLAYESLADICVRQQNIEEAVAYLERVLRSRPDHGLYLRLCSLLLQQGMSESEVAGYLERFQLDSGAIARLLSGIREQRILRLALEALLAGDYDPSLVAARVPRRVPSGRGTRRGCTPDEARQALENFALGVGCSREALQQLEDVRAAVPASAPGAAPARRPAAAACYLLGAACASLNMPGQAFLYFQQAGQQEPENELYAACALEQLAGQCLLFIPRGPALDDGEPELLRELFKLASLRKKAQRIREELAAAGGTGVR
jgi:tetratricopeptide (TPR) repeat protein